MDTAALVQLISNVGFPIAVAVAMFWYNYKMQEQHKEEMDKLNETLANNTLAIVNLTAKLDNMEVKRDG